MHDRLPRGHAYRLDQALQAPTRITGDGALPSLPPLPHTGIPPPTTCIASYRGRETATSARNEIRRTARRATPPKGQTDDTNRVYMTPVGKRMVKKEALDTHSTDTMGT